MKQVLLLGAILLMAFMSKAQNIALMNNSCQPVSYVIFADPGCGTSFQSKPYTFTPGGGMKFSMLPGGPYPPVSWSGSTPPPGSQYTVVKIFDPASAWGNLVAAPCFGGPASFGPQPGCGAQANSTGWNPAVFTIINVF